jgi:hypothetical protein
MEKTREAKMENSLRNTEVITNDGELALGLENQRRRTF